MRCSTSDHHPEDIPLLCTTGQARYEWLLSQQARHKPSAPQTYLLRNHMVSSFFQLPSILEYLSWDIRKPGRKWRNGGSHTNSSSSSWGSAIWKGIFQTIQETPQVFEIWFWTQVCPASKLDFSVIEIYYWFNFKDNRENIYKVLDTWLILNEWLLFWVSF